jgi:hypothetical protein
MSGDPGGCIIQRKNIIHRKCIIFSVIINASCNVLKSHIRKKNDSALCHIIYVVHDENEKFRVVYLDG